MRKALLLGAIICVLALGGIGAAFATGMTGSGSQLGVLSEGNFTYGQINLTHIDFATTGSEGGSNGDTVNVDWFNLYFDKPISANAAIWVRVWNTAGILVFSAQADGVFPATPANHYVHFNCGNSGAAGFNASNAYFAPNGGSPPDPSQPWLGTYYLNPCAPDGSMGLPVTEIAKIDVEVQD